MKSSSNTNLHSHQRSNVGAIALTLVCALGVAGFSLGGFSVSDPVVSADVWRNLPTAVANVKPIRKTVELAAEVRPYKPVLVEAECYLRCEILEMIPEGSIVKKGDVVMRLDGAELEDRMKDRELKMIRYNNYVMKAKAKEEIQLATNQRNLSRATTALSTAESKLRTWEQAEYQNMLSEMNDDLRLSREALNTNRDEYNYIHELASRGIRSWQDVDRASIGMQRAQRDLELARGRRNLLKDFDSRIKEVTLGTGVTISDNEIKRTKLRNSLALTTARLLTMRYERSAAIYKASFERYKNAFESCVVTAPCDGEIAYANSWTRKSQGRAYIELGNEVKNGWDLFYIIDRRKQKLKGRVSDRFASLIEAGQVVEFKPTPKSDPWQAHVSWMSPISFPISKYTPHIRCHWVEILIDEVPNKIGTLTPRQDIDATVMVDVRADVLQVPIGALMEHDGETVVLIKGRNGTIRRPVTLGSVTTESAEILDGLIDGEQVFVAPTEQLRALAETL